MFVKYTGNEDFRILRAGDIVAEDGDEPDWEVTWALSNGHVAEVDDDLGERIVAGVGGFIAAGDEDQAQYEEAQARIKANQEAAAYRDARAMSDQEIESVEPEEGDNESDDDESSDDALDDD